MIQTERVQPRPKLLSKLFRISLRTPNTMTLMLGGDSELHSPYDFRLWFSCLQEFLSGLLHCLSLSYRHFLDINIKEILSRPVNLPFWVINSAKKKPGTASKLEMCREINNRLINFCFKSTNIVKNEELNLCHWEFELMLWVDSQWPVRSKIRHFFIYFFILYKLTVGEWTSNVCTKIFLSFTPNSVEKEWKKKNIHK